MPKREVERFNEAEIADGLTAFRVILDDLTVARLIELAESCHAAPQTVLSAIVRDVLEDDALQNGMMAAMDSVTVQ